MRKTALGMLALLLLGGCTESEMDGESATVASETGVAEVPGNTGTEPVRKTTSADPPSEDASVLLASTLADAKKADKRVMVHLGAPW